MQKQETTTPIPIYIEEIKKLLEERVGFNHSFDIMLREMTFGGVKTGFFYVNGFADNDNLTEIIKRLSYVEKDQLEPSALRSYLDKYVAHIQVELVETLEDAINKVLAGMTTIFIEGAAKGIVVDAKSYPVRGIEEPSLEKVVRGSRDGFVETILINVTLVRRRLRDPGLVYEMMQVGERTKTDVCVGYIKDIADDLLVEDVIKKIKAVNIEGIPLADKQLEEIIIGKTWNPYPLVRYSERPDVISNHLLEGHIVIFADTSPSAMILPTTFFHHIQHAEEFRQEPTTGTYLRWVRFFGIMASLFLLPLWFLFVIQPELKTEALAFIGPKETGELPILLQFIMAEIGVDLMRMAAIHTPTPLATAMGLIAAILIGDIAVQTGLFVNEIILYLAVATIGMFATPSYELGLANRITRLILLVLVAIFKVPGFVIGSTVFLLVLTLQRAQNSPYMWPFIPFNAKAFFTILIRKPVDKMKSRPSLTKPIDGTRKP